MPELPTHTPEGKKIIYYQAGKKPEVYGVFLVDPKTMQLGQSLFLGDIRKQYPKAELRHIVVSEWLAKERLRAEEKEYEREMAEKRAEVERVAPPKSPSETWESYIAKYGTEARIPSKFIAKKYEKQLEEAAKKEVEARPLTKEEEKKHRIAALQAKITGKEVYESLMARTGAAEREKRYIIGRIPEKEAKIKTWAEMTKEERKIAVPTPSAERKLFERGVYVPHRVTARPEDLWGRLKWGAKETYKLYGKAEKKVSEKITRTGTFQTSWIDWKQQVSEKRVQEFKATYKKYEEKKGIKAYVGRAGAKYFGYMEKKVAPKIWGYERGYRAEWREKPLKKGLVAGAFFGVSGVLKGVGGVFAKTGVKVWKPIQWGFGVGLPVLYGRSVYKRVKEVPPEKRPEKIGRIISGEIEPMIVGSVVGERVWTKVAGYWRTRGRELVPPEKIVRKEVLTGEKLFQISGKPHIKYFKKGEYQLPDVKSKIKGAWHAESTVKPSAFRKIIYKGVGEKGRVLIGERELPGAYVAPSLSPYFLRVTPEGAYGFSGIDLFGGGIPTAAFIRGKGFKALKPTTQKELWKAIMEAPKGYAYTHPTIFKSEVEAIYPPGAEFIRKPPKYYTIWKGVRVPIEEFEFAGEGLFKGKGIKAGDIPYYSGKITTPFTYGLGSILQKKYGEISYEPTYDFTYKPSYIPSYQPSYKPTYEPSYRPSYEPSYKPPYTPPYQPPYKPPYQPPYKPPYQPPYKPPYTPPYQPPYQPPYRPPYRPPYEPPYYPPAAWLPFGKKVDMVKAFKVFTMRKGEYIQIGKPMPEHKAMRIGEAWARRTLAARFKLEEAGFIRARDLPTFRPSPTIFRGYRIVKGKPIPMELEWIQKRGKRLSRATEVREIMEFKMMAEKRKPKKKKKIKWGF